MVATVTWLVLISLIGFVQGEAKMGAMLSLIAAPVALLVAKAMRIRMI